MTKFEWGTDSSDDSQLELAKFIRGMTRSARAAITDLFMMGIILRSDYAKVRGETFNEDVFLEEIKDLLKSRREALLD